MFSRSGSFQLLLFLLLHFAVLWSVQGFVNSPKIISKDGNLIFESGANRNISFRLNGTSRLIINDEYDVLDLLMPVSANKKRPTGPGKEEWSAPEETVDILELADKLKRFKNEALGPAGLNSRMGQLQNRTQASRLLLRRLQSRLRVVENKVRLLTTRVEQDSCQSSPCQNGGSCYNTYNGFRCQCRAAFEGTRCERDVNECVLFEGTDLGCQNGGQCVNQFGSFSCLCTPGWHGMHCSQRKTDCNSASAWELCGHGYCVASNDAVGYRCICESGWRSNGLTPTCTEDIDECKADTHTPCSTRCINLPGSFTCGPCDPGLTGNGVSCRDVNECETNNGGCSLSPKVECINTYGSSHCGECPVGWTGDGRTCLRSISPPTNNQNAIGLTTCSQRASLCHPAATCSEISNTVVCSCPQGMVGSGYGEHGCVRGTNNNCNDLPCLNGGVCVDNGVSNYTCKCMRGFHGPRCDPLPNPCTSQPCKNEGHCMPTTTDGGNGFVCQCQPGYRGRLCDTRFSSCNAMLSGTSGRLKYPPLGDTYDHNAQCAWVIRTNESLVLNVTINSFNLEDATDCRFDWLQFNDGRSAAAQIIGRYCGNHIPHGGNIISSSNKLYLWFRSDNSSAHEGFDLAWESIEPQCGGLVQIDTHGTLASPGSPGNYPRNRDCQWHLKAPSSKRIKLTFFSLQLEHHDDCNFDFVSITDSISNRELNKYCSSVHPPPLLLPTHEAVIRFHSDDVGTDLGFQLHYSVEERIPGCGGVYTSREGFIRSPVLATGAEPVSCEYEIRMAMDESIAIEFREFKLAIDTCLEIYDIVDNRLGRDNVLQAKHCGDSSSTPPKFNSMYNQVRIMYYTSGGNNPAGDRFELFYRSDCSRIFDQPNGTVSSPGYPNLTSMERHCTYKILTSPNTVITLKRKDFQLLESNDDDVNNGTASECVDGSSLRIEDGFNQAKLGPYCGQTLPALEYIGKTNMLVLQLDTVIGTVGRGFQFDYTAVPLNGDQCGGLYTKEGQNIRLPVDESGHYRHDLTCFWIIKAPATKIILLHWLSFKLEANMDCSYDYVEVFDELPSESSKDPLVRYCDSSRPEDILSHSHVLTIKFVSDFSEADSGFELSYQFVEPNNCGGHIFASTGMISSPGYPFNYTRDQDCVWQLSVSPGNQLELVVELFELDATPSCTGDWLEVRNGGSNSSALIGRFCGKSMPRRIPSFSHNLYVHFHSDDARNARGFRLSWRIFASGCGGQLTSNVGAITSPNYPGNYPHNANCEWHIRVNPGSNLRVVIEDLQIESLYECGYDFLRISGGQNRQSDPLYQTLCIMPDEEHRVLNLEDNEAVIVFHSDINNNDIGFRLSYSANCRTILNASYGIIESLNYADSLFEGAINCSWQIRPPRGNRIVLEISHFDRSASHPQAEYVGLYIVEGSTVKNVIGPGIHNSSTDSLTIVHNSSSINFRAEYRVEGCLQELRGDSGSFTSPKHPQMYPNNIECYWIIHTTLGQVIELTVHDLDIEESPNCTKDALVISNDLRATNNHERHCGTQTSLTMTSAGHRLHIQFMSDGSHNGRGFTADYRVIKSTCGGRLQTKNGIIQSPGYPKPYPRSSNCEWVVEVTPHHTIKFDMQDIEIESGYSCGWDYVAAYDLSGSYTDSDSDADDIEGQQIFKLCTRDNELASAARTDSATNRALVRFVTDNSVQYKGFRLHFRESCGQTVLIDETDFQYISLLRQVARNESCIWVLQASDPSKHIIFTPTHVQLHHEVANNYPAEADCMLHGIQIYEGRITNGTARQKFCRSLPPALISHGSTLTLSLPMELVAEFEGHYMTMDTACGSHYSAFSGRFTSPYYPSSYPVNIECEWVLEASRGNSLSLTIETIDLEQSDGCNNDYLELRENSERGALIGVYCGNQLPAAVKSKGTMWIKFKSNDDVVGQGFMASYNYDTHNELNGTEGTIQSPNYPTKFESEERYSWRITVDPAYVVTVTVAHLRDIDEQYLRFYDGYTDIGSPMELQPHRPLVSNTNVLFVTATHGPFLLNWERLSKEALASNRSAEEQARQCGQQLVTLNRTMVNFNSPGYPMGYTTNLRCSWTFVPANLAVHAVLRVTKVDLEVFSDECLADYLIISSSSDRQQWTKLAQICKQPNATDSQSYNGTPFLRLEFFTDASVNATGFSTSVRTACGSELTAPQGLVNVTQLLMSTYNSALECIWTIRLRQGKRIRISFPDSQLNTVNGIDQCTNYVVVRNGYADDSPFLGRGKYCTNNITDVLESTSNRVYIKYHRAAFNRKPLSFYYEELGHTCSGEIVLAEGPSGNSSQQIINSPNYPNLPNPHSECVWRIRAPSHHRISVDFVGTFDLTASISSGNSSSCDQEFVQLNDGSTELMPELGQYCGSQKPDTVYSSGSALRIKYFTGSLEPRSGFKAIIKLAVCGGSYYSSRGVISSPSSNQLHLHLQDNALKECVYTIEVERGSTIDLTFESIHLPMSEDGNCSTRTHLLLEEMEPFGTDSEERISDSLIVCGSSSKHYIVETNKIVMRLRMPTGQLSGDDSFLLHYNAISDRCGETIKAVQGLLQTPNYPAGVRTPTHCLWRIEVPKGRRVMARILDFDIGHLNSTRRNFRGRLTFSNDYSMQSVIGRYTHDPPTEVISVDNTMAIGAYMLPYSQHRGFKISFSAYGYSECQGNINIMRKGSLVFSRTNTSSLVYCNYDLTPRQNTTLILQVQHFNTSSTLIGRNILCRMLSPLKLMRTEPSEQLLPMLLCNNNQTASNRSVRVPFPIQMTVTGNQRNGLTHLEIEYSTQRCGGMVPLEPGDNINITLPSQLTNQETVDCAWAVGPDQTAEEPLSPQDVQLEVSIKVNLDGDCQQHYLLVYNGPDQNSPLIKRYCNVATDLNVVVERGLFLEYHMERPANANQNSTFNVTVKYGSGCGGRLTYPYRTIEFIEQYKNNVECIWEIEAGDGFHIGLSFVKRFYIENSNNCTKDYLRVQQRSISGGESNWTDLNILCGRSPPDHINSTSSAMRLIFRSDNDITGDGFVAQFERNCGGILYANQSSQILNSPGYPRSYGKELYCNYTFIPLNNQDSGVLVSFLDFDLEHSPISACVFDNVSVTTNDKNNRVQESVLCGVKQRHAYRAQKSINVLFRTDNSFSGRGFQLEYSTSLCGGVINRTQNVESPRQHVDNKLPHNSDCYWNLTAAEGYKFTIKFELLDFEGGTQQCIFDGVEVYSSPVPDEKQRMARFCGQVSSSLPTLHISSNRALIHSYSDDRDLSVGFKALVRVLPNCDEDIVLGEHNASYTFNKYTGRYANNLDCSFVFHAPVGYQIAVEFRSFHVESTASCIADFLELRDGAGPFADELGKFCGQDLPPKLLSSRHVLFMHFHSDSTITDSGFELLVQAKPRQCGNPLIKLTGKQSYELSSPLNEHGNYDNDMLCLWKIESDIYIHLQFVSLDLEEPNRSGQCEADYIKIYNSENAQLIEQGYGQDVIYNGNSNSLTLSDFATEHVYCGKGQPDDYYPNSKQVYVKFRTNALIGKPGFRLRVVPDEGCRQSFNGLQGRVRITDTADCDIYIVAPANHTLSLYFAELVLNSNDCDVEHIEVFDKATNKSIERLCSYLGATQSLFSNSSELRLHIKTGSYYVVFDMTYVASPIAAGPGCGGSFYNTEGIFTNAFYPKNVRKNSDCSYTVRVPSNTRVLLNFEVFNLGSRTTCRTDYVQIQEENTAGQLQEMRRFCGEDRPRVYLSKLSQLTLRFHKSVNYDGIGWAVKFRGVYDNYQIPSYMLE